MSPEQPGRPEEPREETLLPAVPDSPDGGDPAAPAEEVLGDADTAAAAALARAREAARAKGLRPGSRPVKRRRPQAGAFSSSGRDGRDPSLLGDQMDRLLLRPRLEGRRRGRRR